MPAAWVTLRLPNTKARRVSQRIQKRKERKKDDGKTADTRQKAGQEVVCVGEMNSPAPRPSVCDAREETGDWRSTPCKKNKTKQNLPLFATDLQSETSIRLSAHKHKAPPAGRKQTRQGHNEPLLRHVNLRGRRQTDQRAQNSVPHHLREREPSLPPVERSGLEGCTPPSADQRECDIWHWKRSINVLLQDECERKRGDAAAARWILQGSAEPVQWGALERRYLRPSVLLGVSGKTQETPKSVILDSFVTRSAHTHVRAYKEDLWSRKKTCVLGLIVLWCVDFRVGQTDLVQRRLVRVRQRLLLKGLSVVGIVLKELLGGSAAADLMWRTPLCLSWTSAQSHLQRTCSRCKHQPELQLRSLVWI